VSSTSILARAYELAGSGEYATVTDIGVRLRKEGYTQIAAHLEGLSVRRALRRLMADARAQSSVQAGD
jgi:hypothetical protein